MAYKRSGKGFAFQEHPDERIRSRQSRSYRTSPIARGSDQQSKMYETKRKRERSESSNTRTDIGENCNKYQGTRKLQHQSDADFGCRGNTDLNSRHLDIPCSKQWDDNQKEAEYRNDKKRSQRSDDYLIVDMKNVREQRWNTGQYTNLDEESLHENLRKKKYRRYPSDDDEIDLNDSANERQTSLHQRPGHSSPDLPSSSKLWKEERQSLGHGDLDLFGSLKTETRKKHTGGLAAFKKKKIKGKTNIQTKTLKHQATNVARSVVRKYAALGHSKRIPSLMDLEFPPSMPVVLEKSASSLRSKNKRPRNNSDSEFNYRDRRHQQEYNYTRHDDNDRLVASRRDSPITWPADDNDFEKLRFQDDFDYQHREDEKHLSRYDKSEHHKLSPLKQTHRLVNSDTFQGKMDRYHGEMDHLLVSGQEHSNSLDYHGHYEMGRHHSESDRDSDSARRSWREERRENASVRQDNRIKGSVLNSDRQKAEVHNKTWKKSLSKEKIAAEAANNCTGLARGSEKKIKKRKREKSQKPLARFLVLPSTEGVAVLAKHSQDICLRGRTKLCLMAGNVSIMGYEIKAHHSRFYEVFSPCSTSLITIRTRTEETDKKLLLKSLRILSVEEKEVEEFMDGAVILMARRLDSPALDYICTFSPFTWQFKMNMDRITNSPNPLDNMALQQMTKVGAYFFREDESPNPTLKCSEDFDFAMKKWVDKIEAGMQVAVLCGGVNSGKSTFARFMVNRALGVVPKVCFLDCDPGQTEFSPPGCVALTVVDSPIFGPPFCHQKFSESMCFYGMVTPAERPTHYIQCLQFVYKTYQKMDPQPPLVINTMGWNEGLGLRLFMDVLNMTKPDLVIQIDCSNQALNFPAITMELLALEPGWLYNTEPIEDKKEKIYNTKEHHLIIMDSLVTTRYDNKVKLTPRNCRDLALLAHLVRTFDPGTTLTTATPYALSWSKIALNVCHSLVSRDLILLAINSSIVALCQADLTKAVRISKDSPLFFDETPICECLGYGMVQGVDMEKEVLYVITGLPLERLSKVNTLIKGAISIPDQLFLKQASPEVPYVGVLESGIAMQPVRPRTRMPRKAPFSFD